MRTIKENFEDKARLVGDISDFIYALERPLEREDDDDATLSISIFESGLRTTLNYSTQVRPFDGLPTHGDGTTTKNETLYLDKGTRDCIVDALKERLCQLKKEIKDMI